MENGTASNPLHAADVYNLLLLLFMSKLQGFLTLNSYHQSSENGIVVQAKYGKIFHFPKIIRGEQFNMTHLPSLNFSYFWVFEVQNSCGNFYREISKVMLSSSKLHFACAAIQ